MDYKPYKPFHYNGKDFAKLAVTCQILQDMEKEEQAKKQKAVDCNVSKPKPRTEEQQKRDTLFCIVIFSFLAVCILVTIAALIIQAFL